MAALMPKQLTKYDVTSRLTVPRVWWNYLIGPFFGGPNCGWWTAAGCSGNSNAIRQKGRYMQPVLQSGGWLKFVHYKGLRIGDRVVLEVAVHEFRGTRFVLRAQRFAGQRRFDLM